jgi:hypothetical protein
MSVSSVSHVIDQSPTSASHVGYVKPTITSHAGGRSIVNAIHTSDMKTTTASHAGGTDSIEKPTLIGNKPKFPCNICKGYHLTHICSGLPEA